MADALRVRLGAELHRLREATGLSGVAVAGELGWSQSKVSRVETARFGASLAEIAELVGFYDPPDDVRAELLSTAAQASGVAGAWIVRAGGPKRRQAEVAAVESRLSRLRQYQLAVVPGLLQSPGYARAVAVAGGFADPDEIVQRRLARQTHLHAEDGPRCEFVLDERTLLRWPGNERVLADQLGHLVEASKLSNVDLRLLRTGGSARPVALGSFIVYDYRSPDSPPVVYSEGQTADAYLSDPADVATHSRLFADLQSAALTVGGTRKYLAQLRRDHSS